MDLLTLHQRSCPRGTDPSAGASIIKAGQGIYFAFLAAAEFFFFLLSFCSSGGDSGSEVRNKATCSGDEEAQSLREVQGCSCAESRYVRGFLFFFVFFLYADTFLGGAGDLTDHGDHGARPGHALLVGGDALVQALVVLLHPVDGQRPVASQRDACKPRGQKQFLQKISLSCLPRRRLCAFGGFVRSFWCKTHPLSCKIKPFHF